MKVDNLQERIRLGMTSKVPRWAIAFKYPPDRSHCGRYSYTGRPNWKARLGSIKTCKSGRDHGIQGILHNQDYINSMIFESEIPWLSKAGIIPDLKWLLKKAEETAICDSNTCPICHAQAVREKMERISLYRWFQLFCSVYSKIIYFASKDAMNIEGLGPSSVEALMSQGYIEDFADIYTLKTTGQN